MDLPKRIVITGASSGIGEATAKLLAVNGHRLLLLARSTDKLKRLQAELKGDVRIATSDVRDYDGLKKILDQTIAEWNGMDVLINNAAIGYFEKISEGSIEQWHEMVDINVKGVLNGIHIALPHLIKCSGHIVNVGSVASHQVFPNCGVYCATKHAVIAISESLRQEIPEQVRVTTISPGSVNTPFIDNTTVPEMLQQYKSYFASAMPAEVVAQQILHAINMPASSVISEIVVRPARSVK